MEKKQDNWPNVNKDLEGLSYISNLNQLFTAFLLIREEGHTRSVYFCLASDLNK